MAATSGGPFEQRLDRLWTRWYGVETTSTAIGTEPRALARLRSVARTTKIFGFQNELVEPHPQDREGVVAVVRENQSLWTVGYLPDGTDDPDAVIYDGGTGEPYALIESGLVELLYRTAVIEATFSGSWRSTIADVPRAVIDTILDPGAVVPVLSDRANYGLPAAWDLGDVLVLGYGGDDDWSLFAGTKDLDAFDRSALGSSCRWS